MIIWYELNDLVDEAQTSFDDFYAQSNEINKNNEEYATVLNACRMSQAETRYAEATYRDLERRFHHVI